jgi:hypothetical protein
MTIRLASNEHIVLQLPNNTTIQISGDSEITSIVSIHALRAKIYAYEADTKVVAEDSEIRLIELTKQ